MWCWKRRFQNVIKRGFKVNVDKINVMVASKYCLQCDIVLDGKQLKQVSELWFLDYIFDEEGTDDAV